MKKLIIALAAAVLILGVWQVLAFRADNLELDRARTAVREGDFAAAQEALAVPRDSWIGKAIGQPARAEELARLVDGTLRLEKLSRGELILFEAEAVRQATRFPTVAAAVAGEVARRLRQCVPDPIFVNAERTIRLRDDHPVARLAVGETELPRRADGLFDAGALADAEEPREVRLSDEHGFQAVTRARVRVDTAPPKVVDIRAPAAVGPGALFRIEFEADEPVFEVAEATVRGGRMLGALADGTARIAVRMLAGKLDEPGRPGYVIWSLRLRDRVGNVSARVEGRVKVVE